MKKRLKILGIVTLLTLSIFLTIPKGVFAWVTKGEQISSTNLITLPWHPGTPNLYWRFSFSDTGQVVFCIEPHVVFNGGHSYGYLGKYSAATGRGADIGRQISYVYSANIGLSDNENHQIKQAVIWALNGDYDIYGLDRNNWYVNRAIQLYEEAKNNASGIDIYNQMSTHDLYFNLEGTNWVSNWVYIKPGSSVWSNIGWLQRDGDNWRLVVDNGSLSSAVDTYIYSSMTTTIYDEADVFDGPNNSSSNGQTVAVGGSSYQNSNGEQAYGRITPVGNLVVEEKDNYGTYRQGATFHVTGPGGTWDVTTGNDGKAYLNNIIIGSYQITETQAPGNMKNEEENRTNNINVSAGQTVTYTRINGYPTGSVRLGKYDADHRNSTLGNATLKGAKYNLCAAEDIYEGATLRYSNGQVIREVETDEYGNTPAVTGLPVGNYYYIETQASTGFLKNSDRVPVSINYVNQYTYVIGESYVETAEKPSYSNLKIHKRLGATDYDNEIDLSGVQFKVTLKSDSSQVYYTSVSGADGICTLNNIPYGTYIVSENKLNDAGYKIADFEVFCEENGKTYEYTKVDESKKMRIEVNKEILLHEGEATDAVVSGAVFTVYRDAACTNKVCEIGPTNENGYAISGTMRTGTYYMKETEFPVGINPDAAIPGENVTYRNKVYTVSSDNKVQGAGIVTVPTTIQNEPKRGTIEIIKKLGVTDYDAISNLEGAKFRATLISNPTCYFDSNPTSSDGKCTISDIPYGEYVIEEIVVPDSAYKIENFQVMIEEQGKKYSYTKVDESKKMKIEVNKEILLHEGEATDAVVSGAVFTVYRDATCTNKVCEIGPTNENGYAISGTMRTGTYYMKETTFPTGIDPDATIPGENVTYRNKVYTISENNKTQGNDIIISPITIQNEPNRNDIEIIKDLGETSNTSQFPLDKCKFTATLVSSIGTDHEFSRECTAETDVNGHCIIEDLPYGTYIVEETTVSPISLKCADFTVFVEKDRKVRANPYEPKDGTFAKTTLGETIGTTKEYSTSYNWLDNNGHIVDVPKVMKIKMRKVDANRTDAESPDYTQGDAVLKGAIYQIYRYDPQTDDYTEYVYDITVDHKDSEGYWCAESNELLVGKYMVKEKIKYSETEEGVTYNYSYAEGYLSDPEIYYFEQQPDLQDVRLTYQYDTSKEEVIRGIVRVIKYDNRLESTDEVASKGAILRLVLDSSVEEGHPLKDAKIYYDVKIDQYGYGEFVDTNDDMHETSVKTCYGEGYYPYTIPYGKYTIIEVKESDAEEHTSFFIQPEDVTIERQVQKEYRIEADEPVEMYIKIQKRDKDTGAKVELSGAKYKVWNVEKQEFVSQITYPSGKYIDEFTTAEDGMLTLPHKLEAGDYIIYETQAPEGYYLEDSLRLPENEEDIGKKGGKYVTINKVAMGVEEDTPYNRKDLFYTVDMSDTPLKGNLVIEKKGERLTGVLIETTKYGEKYTPKYTMQGLEGVTYEIRAAEDIKSPDGNVTYVTAGTLVDTITTGEDGIAKTKDLYLGEYTIKEVVTPKGYLTDENIPNVTLENKNQYVKSETTNKELSDVRQKLELTFEKVFEDVNYANGEILEKKAVFGVYTKESIKDHKNKVVIGKDQLVDLIEVNDNNFVTSTIDLPEGKYYVKELDVTFPYTLSVEKRDFDLKYTNHKDEFVVSQGELLENKYEKGSISLFKISTSQIEDLVLNGKEIETEGLDAQLTEMLERFKSMTESEIREYIEANDIKIIPGAKYAIYTDKECQKPLYIKDETTDKFVKAEVVTDESGMVKLEGLPLGEYFLVEVEAPKGYELSKEVVSFKLTNEDKNSMIYRAIAERPLVGGLITKTDIFTSEVVPNCVFEIADEDGKVLMHSITDEEGKAYIVTDMFENGKTYTYTEIEAPEIYELNTEPHEFLAEFDEEGNWTAEPIKVENIRKKSTVTITKLDMVDSTPIPNCKFELKSLETDFKVEGVTDENGIYVFENIPYGKYTYTELEAPEEYLIDTTPHEITIDAEDIKIVVKDDRAPETGDIAVAVFVVIAVVCIAGILFVVIRNKKKNNK